MMRFFFFFKLRIPSIKTDSCFWVDQVADYGSNDEYGDDNMIINIDDDTMMK